MSGDDNTLPVDASVLDELRRIADELPGGRPDGPAVGHGAAGPRPAPPVTPDPPADFLDLDHLSPPGSDTPTTPIEASTASSPPMPPPIELDRVAWPGPDEDATLVTDGSALDALRQLADQQLVDDPSSATTTPMRPEEARPDRDPVVDQQPSPATGPGPGSPVVAGGQLDSFIAGAQRPIQDTSVLSAGPEAGEVWVPPARIVAPDTRRATGQASARLWKVVAALSFLMVAALLVVIALLVIDGRGGPADDADSDGENPAGQIQTETDTGSESETDDGGGGL